MKRVLAVLNKADQLSDSEIAEVTEFLGGELGELIETIVPVSARAALRALGAQWAAAEGRR